VLAVCSQTPDYPQPQAWQELDFDSREDDLEDWLNDAILNVEVNIRILATFVADKEIVCPVEKVARGSPPARADD
jgi:hypothetical protein